MFNCSLILLGALVCASVGCAHRPKDPSPEKPLLSNSLLAHTNSPPGSVYSTKIYVVQKGDNFGKIAAQFGITANELKRLNPMINTTRLAIGQPIRVAEEKFTRFVGDPEWFTVANHNQP
jgi:LysM repeat protein